MLYVALVGTLAESIEKLRAAPMCTTLRWLTLPEEASEGGRIDLIIRLASDKATDPQMLRSLGLSATILATWAELPAPECVESSLHESLLTVYGFVVGRSLAMHEACRWVRTVAHDAAKALDLRTLIIGETGTGKELVAIAIHRLSSRHDQPFYPVNCGGLTLNLALADLFGVREGAYTGSRSRAGAIASSSKGVLFLDEIGELPIESQAALLRVLETRKYQRVGEDTERRLDAQIVCATNRPLDEYIRSGKFRSDLYFRIAQITIQIPPLRERCEDIPILLQHFERSLTLPPGLVAARFAEDFGRRSWPGNIRQLRTVMERIALRYHIEGRIDRNEVELLLPVATVAVQTSAAIRELSASDIAESTPQQPVSVVIRKFGDVFEETPSAQAEPRKESSHDNLTVPVGENHFLPQDQTGGDSGNRAAGPNGAELLPAIVERPMSLAERRADFDKRVLMEVLRRHHGDTEAAADELKLSRRAVYDLIRRHSIELDTLRSR